MQPVTARADQLGAWRTSLRAHGLERAAAFASVTPSTRGVYLSSPGFSSAAPCLPEARCAPARFTLGTLPLR